LPAPTRPRPRADARRGLAAAAAALDARPVLILANHIGDPGALRDAIAPARQASTGNGVGSSDAAQA
jgi:hypothetical protein